MTKLNYEIPKHGEFLELRKDLYWTQFELPFRLNHVNLFFLNTKNGWILIDSGLRSDHSIEMWEKILNGPLKSEKIHSLLITHYHPDHIGMAGWLQKKLNVPAYTSSKELEVAKKLLVMPDEDYSIMFDNIFQRSGIPREQKQEMLGATRLYKNKVFNLPDFKIISEGFEIESNEGMWKVRTDVGHSPEHISLTDKKRSLYLAGDFLLPRISPNVSDNFFDPFDDRLGGYLNYLNDIKTINSEVEVFPCHDWPFKDGDSRAVELINHHNQRLDILKNELLKRNITVYDSLSLIFDRKIGNEQMHFAIGEARSHLINLVKTGYAKKISDSNKVEWFSLNN